ncbi:LEM domain-containing protein 1 [Xenopus laevis]|uniref:LEM domain-containing protein 1 n=1 Tax=Xenopus laevis TaxID=8355 RepID=A0A8J1M8E2_XENLA|nr:LEM domain-containing protein 1 [Xenopus laevis]
MDVRSLSNTELKEQLLKHGVMPGPILPTTRIIYEKRLQQLLDEVSEPADKNRPVNQDQYSDSEDEGFLMKKKEEMSDETADATQNNRQTKIPASLAADYNQKLATLGDDFTVTRILKQESTVTLFTSFEFKFVI